LPRKKSRKKKTDKSAGISSIVEPGVGALYVRGSWMKKLKEKGKSQRKPVNKKLRKRK
jgi:hypothetical protein